jgi:glycosyltransferase involved in cell wall biosynthesis
MDERYSRTWTYFSYLKSDGVDCEYIRINRSKIWQDLKSIKTANSDKEIKLVVGSASQLLVFPTFLLFKSRPYLDAGWSLFESTRVSRGRSGLLYERMFKAYLIDFVATQFSKLIFLESHLQAKWYRRKFLASPKKCRVIYTGIDETDFDPQVIRQEFEEVFTVVFRGKDNPEAGLNLLAKATQILSHEEIQFVVLSKLTENAMEFSGNTTIISSYFDSKQDIARHIANSDLSLGQLSNHPRLSRTIPHKAFESAFLGVPYLSARNSGILEIFQENNEIFCFDPDSAEDLAAKIRLLKSERKLLWESAKRIKETYLNTLSQKVLAEEFLRIISSK